MYLGLKDFVLPANDQNWNVCKPEWLLGAGAIVYEKCAEAGLNPAIEIASELYRSGDISFAIIISW